MFHGARHRLVSQIPYGLPAPHAFSPLADAAEPHRGHEQPAARMNRNGGLGE